MGADGALVAPLDFKSSRGVVILPSVGSIPTRPRHLISIKVCRAGGKASSQELRLLPEEHGASACLEGSRE